MEIMFSNYYLAGEGESVVTSKFPKDLFIQGKNLIQINNNYKQMCMKNFIHFLLRHRHQMIFYHKQLFRPFFFLLLMPHHHHHHQQQVLDTSKRSHFLGLDSQKHHCHHLNLHQTTFHRGLRKVQNFLHAWETSVS